jgi:hypothetical protein
MDPGSKIKSRIRNTAEELIKFNNAFWFLYYLGFQIVKHIFISIFKAFMK